MKSPIFGRLPNSQASEASSTWSFHEDQYTEELCYTRYPHLNKTPSSITIQTLQFEMWNGLSKYGVRNQLRFAFELPNHLEMVVRENFMKSLKDDTCLSCEITELEYSNTILVTVFLTQQHENSQYIDDFFTSVASFSAIPHEIQQDIKYFIACTSTEEFKRRLNNNSENFESASRILVPCMLKGVPCPYFAAAEYCQTLNMPFEALTLLNKVSPLHHDYKAATELKTRLMNEIKKLSVENKNLKSENEKMREELEALRKQLAVPLSTESVAKPSNTTAIVFSAAAPGSISTNSAPLPILSNSNPSATAIVKPPALS